MATWLENQRKNSNTSIPGKLTEADTLFQTNPVGERPMDPSEVWDPNAETKWDTEARDLYNQRLGNVDKGYDAKSTMLDDQQSTLARRALASSAVSGRSGMGGGALAALGQAQKDSNLLRSQALSDKYAGRGEVLGDWSKWATDRGSNERDLAAGFSKAGYDAENNLAMQELIGAQGGASEARKLFSDLETLRQTQDWTTRENAAARDAELISSMLNNPDVDLTAEEIAQLITQLGGTGGISAETLGSAYGAKGPEDYPLPMAFGRPAQWTLKKEEFGK